MTDTKTSYFVMDTIRQKLYMTVDDKDSLIYLKPVSLGGNSLVLDKRCIPQLIEVLNKIQDGVL